MSLRRIVPRLISHCHLPKGSAVAIPRMWRQCVVPALGRGFSSRPTATGKKLTAAEVDAALDKANESMAAYYTYPVEKLIALKKLKFEERHQDKSFYFQLALGMSLLCTFLVSPFLGRKIAYDEDFRRKWIPAWYDYSIERPQSAWTRAELNQQVMALQRDLHERAIAGEFTPEKLDHMRRTLRKTPANPEHAHFSQLHPGVDDDEELEDD